MANYFNILLIRCRATQITGYSAVAVSGNWQGHRSLNQLVIRTQTPNIFRQQSVGCITMYINERKATISLHCSWASVKDSEVWYFINSHHQTHIWTKGNMTNPFSGNICGFPAIFLPETTIRTGNDFLSSGELHIFVPIYEETVWRSVSLRGIQNKRICYYTFHYCLAIPEPTEWLW